jgi:hypothetical protein
MTPLSSTSLISPVSKNVGGDMKKASASATTSPSTTSTKKSSSPSSVQTPTSGNSSKKSIFSFQGITNLFSSSKKKSPKASTKKATPNKKGTAPLASALKNTTVPVVTPGSNQNTVPVVSASKKKVTMSTPTTVMEANKENQNINANTPTTPNTIISPRKNINSLILKFDPTKKFSTSSKKQNSISSSSKKRNSAASNGTGSPETPKKDFASLLRKFQRMAAGTPSPSNKENVDDIVVSKKKSIKSIKSQKSQKSWKKKAPGKLSNSMLDKFGGGSVGTTNEKETIEVIKFYGPQRVVMRKNSHDEMKFQPGQELAL